MGVLSTDGVAKNLTGVCREVACHLGVHKIRFTPMCSSRAKVWLGLGLVLVWFTGAKPSVACETENPLPEEPVETVTSATQVHLNEVLAVPTDGEEFIELEIVDEGGGYLHGWTVQDASGKQFTFDQAVGETHADRYFVLYGDASKIALNNTGDRVDLLNPAGAVVESVEFGSGESGESWSRFESGWEWGQVSAGEKNVALPNEEEKEDEENDGEDAPSESDNTGSGLSPVTELRLNELLPNPEGDESTDEWIELINEGEAGTLLGWSVTDGSSTYQFEDVELAEGEFVLVGVEDSGITLNNTGDVVYLVGPEGEIVQGVEYTDAPSGESFARFGDTWEWTDQVTAGLINVEPTEAEETVAEEGSETGSEGGDEAETEAMSLREVRSLEKGVHVAVSGVVGAEPGPLGAQIMYIQDETGGMQVYSYQKDFPTDLMRGSLVAVSGVTSTAYGEVRINADEGGILVLEQQDEVLPQAVSALVAEDIGELVVMEGMVESKSTSRLFLDSGVEVYIKSSAGISLSEIEAGTQVRVVGVVSQYNDTLRLMPREQADIIVSEVDSSELVSSVAAAGTGQVSSQTTSSGRSSATSGWVVLSLAGAVVLFGSVRSWWKKKRVAKRMFRPYTEGHESQRSTYPSGGISAQLPPGTGS